VNFTVETGEVIGIIGRNGAGKSTLLKILSQITPPTEGEIILRGKVGSLLEVGTGFHPELTGRENVFMNGAILGMGRAEIARKFDAIVEFAGVEKFLDTPVKYYSSGMYVRLAFSVAAHMEPDILIVDEVLAVGDSEFQKKCLGKMEEVTNKDGRTILFVSHNMSAIEQLCKKTILLKDGRIEAFGPTEEVILHYLEKDTNEATTVIKPNNVLDAQIRKISFSDGDSLSSSIPIHKPIILEVEFEVIRPIKSVTLGATFSSNGTILLNSFESDSLRKLTDHEPGIYKTAITIPPFTFNVGNYSVDISIQNPGLAIIDGVQNINFRVIDGDNPKTAIWGDNYAGYFGIIPNYRTEMIK
jgi:lipopolysaccharide transport system ATP-binding protein